MPAGPPPAAPDEPATLPGQGPTRRALLLALRRGGEVELAQLARDLGLSKAAVHKHVRALEDEGLVERAQRTHGRGRPRLVLRLAPDAQTMFPRAYAGVTCAALAYLEERLGREGVEGALRKRQAEVRAAYKGQVQGDLGERVRALARLRDREGYVAEAHKSGKGYELVEANCPILAIAERYSEACAVETQLFEHVLGAKVEATHRVVAGAPVCRFHITPRRGS